MFICCSANGMELVKKYVIYVMFATLANLILCCSGNITEAGDVLNTVPVTGGQTIYAVLLGLFSSFLNGICYCLIRAAAKAYDNPVYELYFAFQKFIIFTQFLHIANIFVLRYIGKTREQ